MKTTKYEIIYSDPVREIISKPPGKITRWSTFIIYAVFLVLILFSWIIKYPDIVISPVEITTINPPVTMVTKITGRINKLFVRDGEKVSAGKLLAVMETAASIDDINLLKSITDTITKPVSLMARAFPLLSELGEMQIYYSTFLKALSDYNTFTQNDFYGNKINSLSDEISGLREYINRIKIKEKIVSENLLLEEKRFNRDSVLFRNKVYSESEFERSLQTLNITKLELQNVRLDQSAKIIELAEKNQLLQDYRITRQEEKEKYVSAIDEALMNLQANIRIWQNDYLLISPVAGTVTFTKVWSANQSVVKDQPVMNVVPDDAGDFIGRIYLNMQRSGKVKLSQSVNIKLSGFPYLEYGMVRGVVKSKSMVTSGNEYVIEVTLPQGLKTLYGKELEFTQNMQGTAEIITEDLRLLQKIINPFRHLVSKNKA